MLATWEKPPRKLPKLKVYGLKLSNCLTPSEALYCCLVVGWWSVALLGRLVSGGWRVTMNACLKPLLACILSPLLFSWLPVLFNLLFSLKDAHVHNTL